MNSKGHHDYDKPSLLWALISEAEALQDINSVLGIVAAHDTMPALEFSVYLYLFHYRSTSAGHQVQVALAAQDTMPAIESSGGTLPFTPPEVAGQVQVTSSQNGTAAVQVIPIENGDAAVKEEMVQSMDNSIARYGSVVNFL